MYKYGELFTKENVFRLNIQERARSHDTGPPGYMIPRKYFIISGL